jgi:hypothetical protein
MRMQTKVELRELAGSRVTALKKNFTAEEIPPPKKQKQTYRAGSLLLADRDNIIHPGWETLLSCGVPPKLAGCYFFNSSSIFSSSRLIRLSWLLILLFC